MRVLHGRAPRIAAAQAHRRVTAKNRSRRPVCTTPAAPPAPLALTAGRRASMTAGAPAECKLRFLCLHGYLQNGEVSVLYICSSVSDRVALHMQAPLPNGCPQGPPVSPPPSRPLTHRCSRAGWAACARALSRKQSLCSLTRPTSWSTQTPSRCCCQPAGQSMPRALCCAMCCAVLCCAVLCCAVLRCAALCCAVLCCLRRAVCPSRGDLGALCCVVWCALPGGARMPRKGCPRCPNPPPLAYRWHAAGGSER